MTGPIATIAIVASLVAALVAGVHLVLNRPPGRTLWAVIAVVEASVVVFVVWGFVQLPSAPASGVGLELVLYLLGLAAVLPATWWWIRAEKSRAAAGVLVVALLVVAIMVVRVQQVWAGPGV